MNNNKTTDTIPEKIPAANETADKNEMELINTFTRRKLSPAQVYAFSLVLCDNEIDRDYERFDIQALHTLAGLFVGKSGIFDHSMKGKDQVARIFSAHVERVEGRTTKAGEPYHRLSARAYMPRTKKNEDIILEIDAGIKKEVSVGCRVAKKTCSVCGTAQTATNSGCTHIKGRQYGEKKQTAHVILSRPEDAYEWSFVAVPAQPAAGVTKTFFSQNQPEGGENMIFDAIKEALHSENTLNLDETARKALSDRIAGLESEAEAGRAYMDELRRRVAAGYAVKEPSLTAGTVKAVAAKMSLRELQEFAAAMCFPAAKPGPQLKSNGIPASNAESNGARANGVTNTAANTSSGYADSGYTAKPQNDNTGFII